MLPYFCQISRDNQFLVNGMYRVFNMGIGFVVIVAKRDLKRAEGILRANRQPFSVIGVCRVGKGVVTYRN